MGIDVVPRAARIVYVRRSGVTVRAFIGQVVVEQDPGGWWVLRAPLKYKDTAKGVVVLVPAGFLTDFASVPRPFWALMSPDDYEYCAAAVVHDRMYETHEVTKAEADAIFYDAMTVHGTPRWKRAVMWWAVRTFGGKAYATGPARRRGRVAVAAKSRWNTR